MADWKTPKFVYNAGGGNVTLTPAYPAVQKPLADSLEVVRNDVTSSDGLLRQSVYERIDKFILLNFTFVPSADMTGWTNFMLWALTGGPFEYYPDSASGTHYDCTLEDTSWLPKYVARDHATFQLKLRRVLS